MYHLPLLIFFNKYAVLYYSRFILLLSLFCADHLLSIIVFNYDYLNSMTISLCSCFYFLYYHFVNLNFICNNNLYIHLPCHFTYDTDQEIIDFKIYLSIISNYVILMLFYSHIFNYVYVYITQFTTFPTTLLLLSTVSKICSCYFFANMEDITALF